MFESLEELCYIYDNCIYEEGEWVYVPIYNYYPDYDVSEIMGYSVFFDDGLSDIDLTGYSRHGYIQGVIDDASIYDFIYYNKEKELWPQQFKWDVRTWEDIKNNPYDYKSPKIWDNNFYLNNIDLDILFELDDQYSFSDRFGWYMDDYLIKFYNQDGAIHYNNSYIIYDCNMNMDFELREKCLFNKYKGGEAEAFQKLIQNCLGMQLLQMIYKILFFDYIVCAAQESLSKTIYLYDESQLIDILPISEIIDLFSGGDSNLLNINDIYDSSISLPEKYNKIELHTVMYNAIEPAVLSRATNYGEYTLNPLDKLLQSDFQIIDKPYFISNLYESPEILPLYDDLIIDIRPQFFEWFETIFHMF